MKQGIFLAATLFMLNTSSAYAAATIHAPEEIRVVAINDYEIRSGLFNSGETTYKVNEGINHISVRYWQYFEHSNGDHDIVKSGLIQLTTPELTNSTYQLKLVNAPNTYEQAKAFSLEPQVALYQDGRLIVEQSSVDKQKQPWLSTAVNGIVDLTTSAIQPSYTPAQPKLSTVKLESSSSSKSSDLIELWKQSSVSQRQQFMQWLTEQAK